MMFAWQAAFLGIATIDGFSKNDMMVYYLFIFVLRTLLSVYPNEISRFIKTGELNNYLVKPLSLTESQLANELAWKLMRFFFLIAAVFLLSTYFLSGASIYLPEIISIPFFLSIVIALLLNFYLKTCIEYLAFWFGEIDGIRISFYVLEAFFAGALLPLSLMPQFIQHIGNFLPFKYFYYFPTQIAFSKLTQQELFIGFLIGSTWLCCAFFLSRFLYSRGLRIYSAYSG